MNTNKEAKSFLKHKTIVRFALELNLKPYLNRKPLKTVFVLISN